MELVMIAKLHKIDELSKLLDDKNELAGNLMYFIVIFLESLPNLLSSETYYQH